MEKQCIAGHSVPFGLVAAWSWTERVLFCITGCMTVDLCGAAVVYPGALHRKFRVNWLSAKVQLLSSCILLRLESCSYLSRSSKLPTRFSTAK